MNIRLALKYDDQIQRPATAWLILGHSVEQWLAELADWQTPLAKARLYALPTSRENHAPYGALVLGAAPAGDRTSPRSLAYRAVAGRLYIPCDARFEPDLADSELAAVLDEAHDPLIWHPQAGLFALSEEAAISVSRLLRCSKAVPGLWTAAVAGLALNAKILSLEPLVASTAEDVFAGGRDDIGTQSPNLDELPPAPGEPAGGVLGELGRAMGRGMARAIQWLTDHAPKSAAGPTWINALDKWAGRRLEHLSKSLEAARNRELLRLMSLLEKNPDEGLKFALPMEGDAHRGIARPTNRLGPRNVDFNLGSLGGGRPTDVWDMSADFRQRLIRRYRDLAAREIALGRHRRAAYIFAKLLNDLRSAAATLAAGGHYREAAVLYEDRLHQPELAADCLRRGGLRTEAIALFTRLSRHETVGDLYAELEQMEEAEAAWERAVATHLAADDVLQAARLLESKLRRVD